MPIEQLTPEQVQSWTRLEKDTWWFERVYRGDMPQLTVRAALTGFLLGGILSATALYIAGKTGITIGVGVTSVVLAFAIFRTLAQVGVRPGPDDPREQLHAVDRDRRRLHGGAAHLRLGGLHAGHRDHRALVADDDLELDHLGDRSPGRLSA